MKQLGNITSPVDCNFQTSLKKEFCKIETSFNCVKQIFKNFSELKVSVRKLKVKAVKDGGIPSHLPKFSWFWGHQRITGL